MSKNKDWVCLVHGYKALPVCGLCLKEQGDKMWLTEKGRADRAVEEAVALLDVVNQSGRHWEAIADALGIPCLAGVDCDPKEVLGNAAQCVEKVRELQSLLSSKPDPEREAMLTLAVKELKDIAMNPSNAVALARSALKRILALDRVRDRARGK